MNRNANLEIFCKQDCLALEMHFLTSKCFGFYAEKGKPARANPYQIDLILLDKCQF